MKRWDNKTIQTKRGQIVYMRDVYKMTWRDIGRYFERDHSSMVVQYRRAKQLGIDGIYIEKPIKPVAPVKKVEKCKYEKLFEVTSGSDYDEIVKKSDKVTKMLAKMTHGERSYRALSRRKCGVR